MNQYDYVITKPPLEEDTLAHYGIKGMKWRRRKTKSSRKKDEYVAKHLADDIISGKRNRPSQSKPQGNTLMNKNGKRVLTVTNNNGFTELRTTSKKALDKAYNSAMMRKKKKVKLKNGATITMF